MELFTNETPFSKKELGIVTNYNIKKMMVPIMILCGLALAGVGCLFYFYMDKNMGVVFWVIAGVFMPAYYLLCKSVMRKNVTKTYMEEISKLFNICRFFEDYMYVESKDNGLIVGTNKFSYKNILKATFLDEYILLFVSKGSCFVLGKNNMTNGSAQDLIIFLYNKGVKFENLKDDAKQKHLVKERLS